MLFCVLAANWIDFQSYQKTLSYADVEEKLEKYLVKDEEVKDYFSLTEEAFVLYDSLEAKKEEYRLELTHERESLKRHKKPLKGAKIALDPGHFGGELAVWEDRFLELDDGSGKKCVKEGDLTLLTALYLKELLEERGVEVFLTRKEKGRGQEPSVTFLEYNRKDLKERAAAINAFNPDLTLVIHYNVDIPIKGSTVELTDKNYTLAFIPGGFCKKELQTKEARLAFLRLLVTGEIEQSEQFARHVVDAMTESGISIACDADYLEEVCLEVHPGVYARNLLLTREVKGPLCYGEAFVQNNREEWKRLSREEECSARMKEMAEVYLKAICLFFADA